MILRFYGHACFGLFGQNEALCLDPYPAGGLGGAVQLPALPDVFTHWVASHEHEDHNAGYAIPSASRLRPTALHAAHTNELSVEAYSAFHDEFGGRLRGGRSDLLRVRWRTPQGQRTLLHCGDLGERPVGTLLDWLRAEPIDVLIVPTGGYFTLGGEAAFEVTQLINPRVVIPCHAREHGVALSQLQTLEHFTRRASAHGWPNPEQRPHLDLALLERVEPPGVPTVIQLERGH